MKKLKIGIIGVGRLGYEHACNIANRVPGSELVAIADANFDRAKQVAEELGVTAVYNDPKALCADPNVEAVAIITNTASHVEMIKIAMDAGKHVFCEKPLADTVEKCKEAEAIIAKDRESNQRDLFEAIERGDYPRWLMQVQLMTEEQARTYKINPFDLTKVWYHGDFPLHDVGILELNRNPENFYAEVEQAAFNPMNIVEGIGFSPDKMLQGRLFSYGDAQRYRLGVNHNLIPVNKPRCPFHAYHRDGQMRTDDNYGATTPYEPNSYGEWQDTPALKEPPLAVDGAVYNYDEREFDDDYYTQPGKLWRLMTPADQQATCENTARAMGDSELFIKQRHVRNCYNADPSYGEGVARALGISLAEALTAEDPAHPAWDKR